MNNKSKEFAKPRLTKRQRKAAAEKAVLNSIPHERKTARRKPSRAASVWAALAAGLLLRVKR